MSEITPQKGTTDQEQPQAEALLGLLYQELRRIAAAKLAQERPGQTLQATALVHEAWLRLTSRENVKWNGGNHFFAAAAEAMRRILVENARRKRRLRHGGEWERVTLVNLEIPSPMPDDEFLALNDALEKLEADNPRAAQIVKLCFFAGLTQTQVAEELGISLATTERTWAYARARLYREMKRSREGTHLAGRADLTGEP